MLGKNLKGYNVVARDSETQEVVVRNKVLKYDNERNVIEVEIDKDKTMDGLKLDVLVYNKSDAYHYKGTIRYFSGVRNTEIAIYKGEEKADRKSERFELNLKGVITESILVQRIHIADEKVAALVVDISTNGIRIEKEKNTLDIGDLFTLQLFVNGESKIFCGKVVRTINETENSIQYGCLLLKAVNYEKIRRIVEGAEKLRKSS